MFAYGLLVTCQRGVADEKQTGFTVREDVTYKTIDNRLLQCDIAVPAGEGPFPAIVMLHGGGWIVGNRSRYRDEIEEAAKRGFVGVTVSYRLAKTGNGDPSVDGFPAALYDVKAAIRFLRRNAEQYHINPEHIGIMGQSAGGHLALLAGLTRPCDKLEGPIPEDAPSSAVQAVVNIFGPTALMALVEENPRSRPVLVIFLGAAPELNAEIYRRASPVTYIHEGAPPVLTFHGVGDGLVPISQAKRLDEAMKQAGASHRLIRVRAGHRFGLEQALATRREMYQFFSETLE